MGMYKVVLLVNRQEDLDSVLKYVQEQIKNSKDIWVVAIGWSTELEAHIKP